MVTGSHSHRDKDHRKATDMPMIPWTVNHMCLSYVLKGLLNFWPFETNIQDGFCAFGTLSSYYHRAASLENLFIFHNRTRRRKSDNRAADQCLCFRYIESQIPPNFQASIHFLWLYSLVCVGNPEDRFSLDAAYLYSEAYQKSYNGFP